MRERQQLKYQYNHEVKAEIMLQHGNSVSSRPCSSGIREYADAIKMADKWRANEEKKHNHIVLWIDGQLYYDGFPTK